MLDDNDKVVTALQNREGMLDPTFVVGCPRSGTTLLARLVGTHPAYAYLEELRFVDSRDSIRSALSNLAKAFLEKMSGAPYLGIDAIYVPAASQRLRYQVANSIYMAMSMTAGTGNTRQSLHRIVKHMLAHSHLKTVPSLEPSNTLAEAYSLASNIDSDLVSQYVEKYLDIISKAERMRILFKDFSILSQKPYVVEKTPGEELSVDKLLDIFPHAKMLHIYRDGRDVVASQLYSDNFYGLKKRKPWRKACQTWLSSTVSVKRLPQILSPNRYIMIRYEEFVSDLSHFAELIFDFLGVPLSVATIEKISNLQSQNKPSRWEKDMTDPLRRKVSNCLNPALKELGYDEWR
ncbi:MAG: sulfotransferase [Deltaproteobacteria bacterium]|nr:sulfotransferase [Deltaproteobacteria bacterium]